jgi:hypothetical protein
MVDFSDNEKITGGVHTSIRIPPRIKSRLEAAAKANRTTLSAEIAYRLAQSLELDPPSAGPPVASDTAIEALTLAQGIVAALREVCDDVFIDRLPDATQSLFLRLGERLAALEKPEPKEKE